MVFSEGNIMEGATVNCAITWRLEVKTFQNFLTVLFVAEIKKSAETTGQSLSALTLPSEVHSCIHCSLLHGILSKYMNYCCGYQRFWYGGPCQNVPGMFCSIGFSYDNCLPIL